MAHLQVNVMTFENRRESNEMIYHIYANLMTVNDYIMWTEDIFYPYTRVYT